MKVQSPFSFSNHKYYAFIFGLISFLFISNNTFAQNNFNSFEFDANTTYKITLLDGSEFVGRFVEKNSTILTISTSSLPKIEIPFSQIKSIQVVDKEDLAHGSYWFPNPNSTRYFFSPSAFNLKKGEGYYQNSYLLFNSVNYGLTNNISIGGGFELISTFSGDPIFFLTPKLGYELTENFNVGAGVLLLGVAGEGSLGIAYGLGTYGNRNDNISMGLGWGFVDKEFSGRPTITLSGMTRVKRKFTLVTENWFIPWDEDSYYGLFSYGMRFFSEKIAVDLGFINNKDIAEGIAIGVPYVDFVVKF